MSAATVATASLHVARARHLHDPGRLALRRAARVAIALPPVFAFCLAGLHNSQTATFAAFGAFAMLVFADFTGPPGARAGAYAALAIGGLLLITAGTLLSGATWTAAAGMAAVGFIIVFAGFLGGYIAAGGFAAILAFRPRRHSADLRGGLAGAAGGLGDRQRRLRRRCRGVVASRTRTPGPAVPGPPSASRCSSTNLPRRRTNPPGRRRAIRPSRT